MRGRYFEEFAAGQVFETAGITLTESMIIDFALAYDTQPFHVDAVAAASGPFGGIIASGFQTMALTFRLFRDTGLFDGTGLGSPGGTEMRWLRPVRPGDTLRVRVEVAEVRPSSRQDDRGYVTFRYETRNQRDEPVLAMTITSILARRPAG